MKMLMSLVVALAITLGVAGAAAVPAGAGGVKAAVINGSQFTVAGENIPRDTDTLVLFTRTAIQTVSPANRWGAEVAVDTTGNIIAIRDRRTTGDSGMPIPPGGYVLSGHGAARLWLLKVSAVGRAVVVTEQQPIPTGRYSHLNGRTYKIAGTNTERVADALVMFTRTSTQTASPANGWGSEIAVLGGRIIDIRDRQSTGSAGIPIPSGGYVLSGHGAARLFLVSTARVGAAVVVDDSSGAPDWTATPTPTPTPTPTTTTPNSPRTPMPTTPAKDKTTGSVNFKSSTPTSENAVGLGISTYGANALGSTAQRDAEKALDARYVRIPVGYRDGRVTTSAAGAGTTLDVAALVKQYQSWGYRVIAVIGGRTNDFDVQAGDTTRIIQSLGTKGIDYTSPNEPGNLGKSITDSISMSKIIVAEGKAIDPNFKLGGPVWAWPSIGDVVTYGKAIGAANLGVSDWHHYAMGTNSISTEQAMAETAQYAANVNEARTRLRAEGLPDRVVIDEMNFSWRYADGTAPIGNNDRFYTAVNTVWTASALGQVLKAGGSGLIYSNQNGPLGVMVESGNRDGGRAGSSPMPAYWGITAWTGADLFPHMTDTLYATASSDPKVETYAVSNEAGGTNVVLVNKSETRTVEHTVDLNGFAGSATLWQTDPAQPFDAPKKLSQGAVVAGTAVVNLPPMSVSVVVLT